MVYFFLFFLFIWATLVLAAPFLAIFCAGNCAVLSVDLAKKRRIKDAPRSFWRAFKKPKNAWLALFAAIAWLSYALPILPDLLAALLSKTH